MLSHIKDVIGDKARISTEPFKHKKRLRFYSKPLIYLVGCRGLEPRTYGLRV